MTLISALLGRHYRYDEADPHWPDRDRLLARMADPGQAGTARADPDLALVAGFGPGLAGTAATLLEGPPGLAFGAALGMALAERVLAARFGKSLVDHRVWLVADAMELAAGTAQEAAGVAGALTLGRLAVLARLPENARAGHARLLARFSACGWTVRVVEGGDTHAADAAISACLRSQKPTLLVEFGLAQGGLAQFDGAASTAAADSPALQGDEDGQAGKRGAGARRAWLKRLRRHANREVFQHALSGHLPPGWHKAAHVDEAAPQASHGASASASMGAVSSVSAGGSTGSAGGAGSSTGAAGGAAGNTGAVGARGTQAAIRGALARLAGILPDLTHLPLAEGQPVPQPAGGFARNAMSWEGLELAAPAALLGMALHGAVLPVSWSAAAPVEWALPAMRAAAARHLRWLHIFAAPGPAGLPVHIDNLHVFAPADAAEAQDCLVLALRRMAGPSLMLLSPGAARLPAAVHRLCARGAYLVQAPALRDLTLLASGQDLILGVQVQAALSARGVNAALVSMPCRALFDVQDTAYRQTVLGDVPRIAFARDHLSAFAGLTGPGDLILGDRLAGWPPEGHGTAPDAAGLAAFILRCLHRSTPELEPS